MTTATHPQTLTVTIPLSVSADLSPNARVLWPVRYRATETAKTATHYAMREAIDLDDPVACFQRAPWPLTLNYTIGLGKGRRRMDDDNAIACMKPIRDQVAICLGMDDRHFLTGTIDQVRDPEKRGFVRVTIVAAGVPS